MPELDDIKRPISAELGRRDGYIERILGSGDEFVSAICRYVIDNRGKQMRPLLALLAAQLHGGITEKSHIAAALVDLIHTASLVHDDVVDESDLRRGKPSVKAKWDSRTAVLVGDFIFARTYYYSLSNGGGIDLLCEITRAVHEIGEGELIQSGQSYSDKPFTRELYNEIVEKKTASLIAASAAMGAISAGASEAETDKMRRFGTMLGMAFQIKDDILDYTASAVTGKPRGSDIRERKINLPLLYAIQSLDAAGRDEITALMNTAHQNPSNIDHICETVIRTGGIDHAGKEMERYLEEALSLLDTYPESDILTSMKRFARYVVSREK